MGLVFVTNPACPIWYLCVVTERVLVVVEQWMVVVESELLGAWARPRGRQESSLPVSRWM